ncbi:Cyclic di-GMP phosphodiesterase YfgF [bacterium HR29]|nr:Cyclic di-GMP phosphodiesterase YfgF [bacterium HR29]
MGPGQPSELQWEQALVRVLRDPERIALYRQPIVDLRRGVTAGFELLARFADPEVDAPPFEWFRQAYAFGLGPRLEAAVVRQALRLRDELPPNTFLTVNLDPAAVAHPDAAEVLLVETRLDRVVIEITETSPLGDVGELGRVAKELRERGAFIAVDDTGTGYAGLERLLAVRPQFVKVDRAFVEGVDQDGAKRALLELVGHFASRLDAWVVAEGIERVEELAELIRLGVPLGQGFLLNRPAPEFRPLPREIGELIRRVAERRRLGLVAEALLEAAEAVREGELPPGRIAVVVDGWGRPLRVWDGERDGAAMKISPSTAVAQAARRAMLRPYGERFLPLTVVDDAGRLLGIVRVERMVEVLASEAAA